MNISIWFLINIIFRITGVVALVIAAFAPLFERWDIMYIGAIVWLIEEAISGFILSRLFCSECLANIGFSNKNRGKRHWEIVGSKTQRIINLCKSCSH